MYKCSNIIKGSLRCDQCKKILVCLITCHQAVQGQVGQVESSGAQTEHPDCQPATLRIDRRGRGVLHSSPYFIFNFLFDPLDSV